MKLLLIPEYGTSKYGYSTCNTTFKYAVIDGQHAYGTLNRLRWQVQASCSGWWNTAKSLRSAEKTTR